MSTIRKAAQVAWAVLFWVLLVFLAAAWILLRVSLGTT
jgi:hypothetical protein